MSRFWVLLLVYGLLGCGEKEMLISGKTMGSTYHIKVISYTSSQELREKIEKRLDGLNHCLSVYQKDSEISRFNASKSSEKFYPSQDFKNVLTIGRQLFQFTQGAWDGTIHQLALLWGFTSDRKENQTLPKPEAIQTCLKSIGFNHIIINSDSSIQKKNDSITLDLNSLAQGYASDQIALLIKAEGIDNYLVEIGGEVVASGHNLKGKPWRVGINTPFEDAPLDAVYKVVSLQNKALSTSGNYRNFFKINDKLYAHILDPKSGYPVENGVVSATVMADNCTFADGLATALVVMGVEKALALVNQLDNIECLIIVKESDSNLKDYYSKGFKTEPF
ncbi:MAG: FAD:protein FMN transferase [Desulfobacterales bacterium]|nr:FAD:protein FMN transferase [Desulfobacterales bacterium]